MEALHPGFPRCVQGQYVVTSVPEGGATLVVSPRGDVAPNAEEFHVEKRGDFCKATPHGYEVLRDTWRAVEAPRGCVILWLSRLPHANKKADYGVDPRRFVIYVCWQSRALVDESERATLKRKKMDAINSGGTTDHWPTNGKRNPGGNHYSNKDKKTKVVYSRETPPEFSQELLAKIEASL